MLPSCSMELLAETASGSVCAPNSAEHSASASKLAAGLGYRQGGGEFERLGAGEGV